MPLWTKLLAALALTCLRLRSFQSLLKFVDGRVLGRDEIRKIDASLFAPSGRAGLNLMVSRASLECCNAYAMPRVRIRSGSELSSEEAPALAQAYCTAPLEGTLLETYGRGQS